MGVIMCLVFFSVAVFMVISQKRYFLVILLSVEVMVLALFLGLVSYSVSVGSVGSILMGVFFLTFSVCEASIGLGVLVATVRFWGGDYSSACLSLKF
uniref:NADH-ubiquinone oxidoreductase chain 4L n=1 Tax=Panopea globosa TaxID=1237092 RepID=A0A0U1XJM2_9BIVA|nr:NADH dehydrogenase subunit 4L [Panopea globosa]AIU56061.1 NADH dehydrogenase subunit 4L [Panopea globosa]